MNRTVLQFAEDDWGLDIGPDNNRSAAWRYFSDGLNTEFGRQGLEHCSHLNGQQFAVTPGVLRACGSATHAKGSPAICSYTEPTVSSEEFLTGLAQVIRENQAETGPCVGCRNLVATAVPRRFVASFFTSISLHDFCGCNAHCVYCAGSEYQLPQKYVATFDHQVLFRDLLADRMVRPAATSVSWGGGEPTLVNSFDGTVDFLSENRIRQIINTSGIRFSSSGEKALVRRTASVCISVDSGTNETYARVKQNHHCDDVWESIRRYAATGGAMVVKYIIFSMNSNLEEVEAFVGRCQKAGVRRIRISADARSVFDSGAEVEPVTEKELSAAASMRNLAMEKGIEAMWDDIWTSQHLQRIGDVGGFDVHRKPSRLRRIRRVSSLADARELVESAVEVVRRKL